MVVEKGEKRLAVMGEASRTVAAGAEVSGGGRGDGETLWESSQGSSTVRRAEATRGGLMPEGVGRTERAHERNI